MRRRSVKAACGWKECMCMRCVYDCCIDHPDYLCPANLEPETQARLSQEYGFMLECPDFVAEEQPKEGGGTQNG